MRRVRALLSADLEAVLQIQAVCPEAAQWSVAAWRPFFLAAQEASSYGRSRQWAWLAEEQGRPLGFIAASFAADEMEILNLAVAQTARRAGVGSRLLAMALDEARRAGITRAFLEVRASNSVAIAFYCRHGFSFSFRRPSYYSNPPEDAVVFSISLVPDR